jgi:hypothetical protein
MPSGYIAPALLEPKTPDPQYSELPSGVLVPNAHEPTVDNIIQTPPSFYAGYFMGSGQLGVSGEQDATAPSGTLAGDLLLCAKLTLGATGYTNYDYVVFLPYWHWRIATGDANDNIAASQCGGGCLIWGWRDGPNYSSGLFLANEIGGTVNGSRTQIEWGPHSSFYGSSKGLIMLYCGIKGTAPDIVTNIDSGGNFSEDATRVLIGGEDAALWGHAEYESDGNLPGFLGNVLPANLDSCRTNYSTLFINKL